MKSSASGILRAGIALAAGLAMTAAVSWSGHGTASAPATGEKVTLPFRAYLPAMSHDEPVTSLRTCDIAPESQEVRIDPSLDSQLLTISDLPGSWSVQEDSEDGDVIVYYRAAALPGEMGRALAGTFESPTAALGERLLVYASPERARELFAEAPREVQCTAANITAGKWEPLVEGVTFTVAGLEYVAFPHIGDGALAFRLSVDVDCGPDCAGTIVALSVYALKGAQMVQVAVAWFDPTLPLPIPAADLEAIVARAVAKLSS